MLIAYSHIDMLAFATRNHQPICQMLIMGISDRHGAEQYAGDLECVFYGYHLDRAILNIAEAAYCLMPSLA